MPQKVSFCSLFLIFLHKSVKPWYCCTVFTIKTLLSLFDSPCTLCLILFVLGPPLYLNYYVLPGTVAYCIVPFRKYKQWYRRFHTSHTTKYILYLIPPLPNTLHLVTLPCSVAFSPPLHF
jgi:hypothetical protein